MHFTSPRAFVICVAIWGRPEMKKYELARIWIACSLTPGVCPRDTLFFMAKEAFGEAGIGTDR